MAFRNEAEFKVPEPELLAALRAVVPPHCLLEAEEERRPYECDGLSAYRETPLAVVIPEHERQVIEVLKTCHRFGAPVVPRGVGGG